MFHRQDLLPKLLLASLTLLALDQPLRADDGDPDPTWGVGGLSYSLDDTVPRAAGVAPDQQVYLTGNTTLPDDSEFEWWRSDNEGVGQWYGCSHDLPLLDNFDILEVLFDSSDRMLLAGRMTAFGTETVERAFVARFLYLAGGDSCTLDSSFSGGGWEFFDDAPYCDTEDCRFIDIEVTADTTTRYIVLLESVQNVLMSNYYLLGLTEAGSLDPNFNSGAFLQVTAADFAVTGIGSAELAVDRGNRALVLYSFYDPDGNFDLDVALNRYQQHGVLDGTFATNGRMLIDADDFQDTSVRALALGSDGRVGYATWNSDNYSKVRVFDPTVTTSAGDTRDQRDVGAIAFDGLGRLLVTADVANGDGMEVSRWTWTLSPLAFDLDAGFGVAGVRFIDIEAGGGNAEAPVDIETPGGKPMLLVSADQSGGGQQTFLFRLENSLIFADGFEWGSTKFW